MAFSHRICHGVLVLLIHGHNLYIFGHLRTVRFYEWLHEICFMKVYMKAIYVIYVLSPSNHNI